MPVPGLTGLVDLAVGEGHVCAVDDTHTLWCWGANEQGSVGDGSEMPRPSPVALAYP